MSMQHYRAFACQLHAVVPAAGVAEAQRKLTTVFNTVDFQVSVHDGPTAGQEGSVRPPPRPPCCLLHLLQLLSAYPTVSLCGAVPHVHVHVIPREPGDGGRNMLAMWPSAPPIGSVEPDFAALGELSSKLQAA